MALTTSSWGITLVEADDFAVLLSTRSSLEETLATLRRAYCRAAILTDAAEIRKARKELEGGREEETPLVDKILARLEASFQERTHPILEDGVR